MPSRIPYHKPITSATFSKADPQNVQRREDLRFYNSAAWRKLRLLKLDDNPLCERCEKEGLTTAAVHVHHVKARKAHPDLELDIDNLEALCSPCHTRHEKTKPKG